ncbi:hypothetical protein METBIDRAFT_13472 [Metschnikowia bicuspidata var. bicuspidata NRRL YB-4993]|uniref:Uncharacterized protein n=1 Tax=Metschnikowia bicuspidata var. bicuspidata NRRL YB-4993 TaxID=869754 RepID=A0A1A0H5D3_9ASCO|nr:hypothetical protein METBIDRAFT_13472 [Metschnikowia bicuspidata var. bicuspidata NRRL YB-4993]OBA19160.1 hypothetical protein METBIDRAFT_13472 [Metschnikowia bicuspidata var. bicuspidata NRRL YB-4993]
MSERGLQISSSLSKAARHHEVQTVQICLLNKRSLPEKEVGQKQEDPDAPKMYLSAFMFFANENRDLSCQMTARGSETPTREAKCCRHTSGHWSELSLSYISQPEIEHSMAVAVYYSKSPSQKNANSSQDRASLQWKIISISKICFN